MNRFVVIQGARIVEEVMRDEYGMPPELAEQIGHVLRGGAHQLMMNGFDVLSVHVGTELVDDDGLEITIPHGEIRTTPDDEGTSVLFQVRIMLESED